MKLHGPKFAIIASAMVISACVTQRPSLYPNSYLQSVGTTVAQQDVDDCMRLAQEYGVKTDNTEGAVGETATNATIGAASGAAVGAIYDNAGEGAAAGAVGSTVSGLMRRALRPSPPNSAYRQFVERCLREKGYEPIGWQ